LSPSLHRHLRKFNGLLDVPFFFSTARDLNSANFTKTFSGFTKFAKFNKVKEQCQGRGLHFFILYNVIDILWEDHEDLGREDERKVASFIKKGLKKNIMQWTWPMMGEGLD
jgi:hypothetical protein